MRNTKKQKTRTTLSKLFEDDLTRSHRVSRKDGLLNYCNLIEKFEKNNIEVPWCFKSLGDYYCFLEFDIQSAEDFKTFMEVHITSDKVRDKTNFTIIFDDVVLLLQSWNNFSAQEERKYWVVMEHIKRNFT